MRVIAGIYGGRRLNAPRGAEVRPTADRVKEALFSMLGPLDGLAVLDLFAGSGALGIEALSRGADSAVFVDHHPGAVRAVSDNLAALGIAAPVHHRPARAFLDAARFQQALYDLVFIDPPYRQATVLGPELNVALPPILGPAARVVVESDRRSPLDLSLALGTERRYGDTLIRIHTLHDS